MVFNNNYLENLLSHLEEEEFNYSIPCQNSQDNPLLIPKRGQLIFLEDLNKLIIGDGISRQDNCLGLILGFPSFSSINSKEEIIYKTWAYLSSTARIFELEKILLPTELQSNFIKQKPDNFTFFLGDPIPDKSPLGQFARNFPNLAGYFLRNYNHSKNIDSQGNRDMFSKQNFDMEKHQHKFWYFGYTPNIKNSNTDMSYFDGTYLNYGKSSVDFAEGENLRMGKEVRPKNFTTLICMRIY